MSELIEIARIASEERQKQEEVKFNRDQSLIQQQSEAAEKLAQTNWERLEITNQKNRETDIYVKGIDARGRATDKQSDDQGFQAIADAESRALKQMNFDHKADLDNRDFNLRENNAIEDRKLKMEKFKLETQKLEMRSADNRSKEYVAAINKN